MQECRFCLESEVTRENPLISPCLCRGSVAYIHVYCLKRWVFNDGTLDPYRLLCSICKTPFQNYLSLEVVPDPRRSPLFFLFNTAISSIMIQYFYMLYHLNTPAQPMVVFTQAEFIVHCIYVGHILLYCRIRNIKLYMEIALTRRRLPCALVIHIYMILYFLSSKNVTFALAMNFLMGGYWPEHCRILEEVNVNIKEAIGM